MIPVLRYLEDCYADGKIITSITELPIEQLSHEDKQKVVSYLLNKDFRDDRVAFMGPRLDDAFTGEKLWANRKKFSDGKWDWFDDLPCYVELYDVQLPVAFLQDVALFYNQGGIVDPILVYSDMPEG